MVMDSGAIAQMNAMYLSQHMRGMQMAGMIGPAGLGASYAQTPSQGAQMEGLTGSMINRATAVGAPMATMGLSLAGMDPLSLGVGAGGLAMGAGLGIGGGIAAGGAVALPAMAAYAGAQYAGNQMYTGMQQTQQFHQGMRQNYNFFNPNNAQGGGRGFAEQDIRDITSTVRSMSFTDEAGGAGFNELGQLATRMGQMGMAGNVRNAKEFAKKFREMIKETKEIAEAFHTTLSEAQTMMASMKSSGIFKNQGSIAGQIKNAAVSGGLATTEITGMMNIGSQISRMHGGLGSSGAQAGITALSQIGTAQQIGAINEEDIYNATGLTGAEGRRAFAQRSLMKTGSFLRSGKGRYMLAALAGKDGQLDENSVQAFMTGSMDVGGTRAMANQNLGRVGRANFIRNEGRLRGEVMKRFGNLAPAMALSQWANSRGVDINSMGDREMLFAQRQLGMGRDEMDVAVKMARRLPDIMDAQRGAREDASYLTEQAKRQRTTGMQGLQKKFEDAKNRVDNELRTMGGRVLDTATDRVNAFANALLGVYENTQIEGIREETRRIERMGKSDQTRALRGLMGGGNLKGAGLGVVTEDKGARKALNHMKSMSSSISMMRGFAMSDEDQAAVSGVKGAMLDSYARGGIGDAPTAQVRVGQVQRELKRLAGSGDKNAASLLQKMRGMDERDAAGFVAQMERKFGIDKSAGIGSLAQNDIERMGLPDLRRGGGMASQADRDYAAGSAILGGTGQSQALAKAGSGGGSQALANVASGSGLFGVGAGLLGYKSTGAGLLRTAGDLAGGAGAAALGLSGLGGLVGGAASALRGGKFVDGMREGMSQVSKFSQLGSGIEEAGTGNAAMRKSLGSYLHTKEGRQNVLGVLTGDDGAREAALGDMATLRARQSMGKSLSDADRAKLAGVGSALMTADYMKAVTAVGGDPANLAAEDWETLTGKLNKIREDSGQSPISGEDAKRELLNVAKATHRAASQEQRAVNDKVVEQVGQRAAAREAEYSRATIRGAGGKMIALTARDKSGNIQLSKEALADAKKNFGAAGVQALRSGLESVNKAREAAGMEYGENRNQAVEASFALQAEQREAMTDMSVGQLRSMAQKFAGTQVGADAGRTLNQGISLARGARRKGAAGAIGERLGLKFDRNELRGLRGLSAEEAAKRLASGVGAEGDSNFVSKLQESIEATKKGGVKGGLKGANLLDQALAGASDDTRKKIQDAQDKGASPLDKLVKSQAEGNRYLEALVRSNDAANKALAGINNNTAKAAKNGEGGKGR